MRSLRDAMARLRASLLQSIGDVTFGMEDGAVSIAGLVFGVAASTNDARIVVLAGATGAVAGAVSMMAGTYLDVHSERSLATAQVDDARTALAADPEPALSGVAVQVRAAGFTSDETDAVVAGLRRNPEALLSYVAAFELGVPMRTESSPRRMRYGCSWPTCSRRASRWCRSCCSRSTPRGSSRWSSTAALMAALGVARALIGHESVYRTALQTMGIAGGPPWPGCSSADS